MLEIDENPVANLLIENIPRDLVMGIEEALLAGAYRAFGADARTMDEGHLPSVVGQMRHFHMNEAYHRALAAAEANPTPIRGNGIVTGRSGVFTLARFNIKFGFWVNGQRGKTRRQMALANAAIEPLVQPNLFESYRPPSEAVVFFVACFSGSLSVHPEAPEAIHVAVPDHTMKGWLFREPIGVFLQRYEAKPIAQDDLATPKLKRDILRRVESTGTEQ